MTLQVDICPMILEETTKFWLSSEPANLEVQPKHDKIYPALAQTMEVQTTEESVTNIIIPCFRTFVTNSERFVGNYAICDDNANFKTIEHECRFVPIWLCP